MLQYSDGTDSGKIFAIFWSIFNLSAVLGGFITYIYFSSTSSSGNVVLFFIFLTLITIGAFGALMLAPPESLRKRSPASSKDGIAQPMLGDVEGKAEASEASAALAASDISSESWVSEFAGTVALFVDPRMARMALIYLYTGFNQPYQLVTFGDRFFTPSTLGLMVALFYSAELVGAFVSAKVVDAPGKDDRAKASTGYALFFSVTTLGYIGALVLELPRVDHPHDVRVEYTRTDTLSNQQPVTPPCCSAPRNRRVSPSATTSADAQIPNKDGIWNLIMGGAIFFLWGFSDSQIQVGTWGKGQRGIPMHGPGAHPPPLIHLAHRRTYARAQPPLPPSRAPGAFVLANRRVVRGRAAAVAGRCFLQAHPICGLVYRIRLEPLDPHVAHPTARRHSGLLHRRAHGAGAPCGKAAAAEPALVTILFDVMGFSFFSPRKCLLLLVAPL